MNRRLFIFVIILMGVSLAGIILLQLFWISNAISIREEHFNKSVNLALSETAEKLASHENILYLSDRFHTFGKPAHIELISDSIDHEYFISLDSNGSTSFQYNISSSENANFNVSVWTEDDDMVEIREYKHEVSIDSLRRTVSRVKAVADVDSITKFITHDIVLVGDDSLVEAPEDGYLIVKRAKDLNEAFIKMAYEIESKPIPIEERIDTTLIHEILDATLFNKGIRVPYEFAVLKVDTAKFIALQTADFSKDDLDVKFVVSIFPNELQDVSNFLVLQFPGRNVHILKSMIGVLAASLLLTLIILATFGITIYMILRQKKLSDIKSDFINNMTHEFKTPIATISLATDSITNPKIISNEKEVRYYTDIIREENQRMNNQVESVLRMSLLDKHELEFNFIESDIHCLIEKAVAKLGLQLEERNAKVDKNLNSADPVINIDPDHFTNAILNLLDNALKYSESEPQISISTSDSSNGIEVSVSDNGIGMSREVQSKIFDRFYRKPSGNIHNIKGFGLGLSYVKAVIDAFKGDIKVSSESGKGSTFTISIPRK